MKHQQCVYMPSTVEDWLQEQLVKRGIDAVLFTQYILNLIQSVLLNPSRAFLNDFEQNGLEMLVTELCVNLVDAVNKCEVVIPFLDSDQYISDVKRNSDMSGFSSNARFTERMSALQDCKMELDLQAILHEDEVPVPHNKEPRPQQKCRRDLYLAFTQSLSQEDRKQAGTIPLGYTGSNDLRIPRVQGLDQAIDHEASHKCGSQCREEMTETSSSKEDSPRTEDRNLARLIAKFDSSIQALWNPDGSLNGPFAEACWESDHDFTSSFQQLDPSPTPMDIPSNKPNSFSFIPYGTNISSIWSTQPSPEELVSKPKEEDTFSCAEKMKPNDQALIEQEQSVKSLWAVPNPLPEHMIQTLLCEADIATKPPEPAEKHDKISIYLGADPNDSFAALNHSKEDSSFTEVKPRALGKSQFTLESSEHNNSSSSGSSPQSSLPPVSMFLSSDAKRESTANSIHLEPLEKRRKETEKEDEPVDLLMSQTTHFSPIRKEARTASKPKQQSETIRYEDGTTFAIPNALERLNFTRSDSGGLYLDEDSEDESGSPTKYMEFKERSMSPVGSLTIEKDFVPKFRVNQNEKCCQTDGEDLDEFCSEECSIRSIRSGSSCWTQGKVEKGFNFACPEKTFVSFVGMERASMKIIGDLNEEVEEEVEEEVRKTIEGRTKMRLPVSKKDSCFKCARSYENSSAWATATDWPSESMESLQVGHHPGIWQGTFTLMTLQPASDHGYPTWSEADGDVSATSGLCWECVANAENHKSQLREELIQEGEQLLTDLNLNSLSHLYLLEDKRDHPEKVADFAAPFSNSQFAIASPRFSKWEAECTAQKERKRRYSSSQRACSFYLEGNCHRPHCRFSHELAAIPCRFWGDASCLKGENCPLLHGNLHSLLRPVTL